MAASVIGGFNACILAYGQTGSGKTYTMEGPPEDPGINYRMLSKMFDLAAQRRGSEYRFRVSMVEIYNEELRDLLVDPAAVAGKIWSCCGRVKPNAQACLSLPSWCSPWPRASEDAARDSREQCEDPRPYQVYSLQCRGRVGHSGTRQRHPSGRSHQRARAQLALSQHFASGG